MSRSTGWAIIAGPPHGERRLLAITGPVGVEVDRGHQPRFVVARCKHHARVLTISGRAFQGVARTATIPSRPRWIERRLTKKLPDFRVVEVTARHPTLAMARERQAPVAPILTCRCGGGGWGRARDVRNGQVQRARTQPDDSNHGRLRSAMRACPSPPSTASLRIGVFSPMPLTTFARAFYTGPPRKGAPWAVSLRAAPRRTGRPAPVRRLREDIAKGPPRVTPYTLPEEER